MSQQTSPMANDEMGLVFQELYAAIGYGDLDRCRHLINQHSIDVNWTPEGDYTSLLVVAIRHGKLDMVNLMLENGADPSIPYYSEEGIPYSIIAETFYCADSEDGARTETPIKFHEGAFLRIIKRLVECGADVHAEVNGHSLLDMSAYCPYPTAAIMSYFAQKGVKANSMLTQEMADKACEVSKIAEAIYHAKPENVRVFDDLWEAIRSDDMAGVTEALMNGADINGLGDRMPLDMAILNQNLSMVRHLVGCDGIDLSRRTPSGRHILETCFYTRNYYAGYLLFQTLMEHCQATREELSYLLRMAIELVNPYIVSYLCSSQYVNPLLSNNDPSSDAKTPYTLAVKLKNVSFYHEFIFDVMEWYTAHYRRQKFEPLPDDLKWENVDGLDYWFFRNINHELLFSENGVLENSVLIGGYPAFAAEMPRNSFEVEFDVISEEKPERMSGSLKVFDVDALKDLLKLDGQEYRKLLSSLLSHDSGYRNLQTVNPAFFEHIEELKVNYPNMTPFIEYVERNAILREFREDPSMYFPPVLLVSKPGVGKTACVKAVADLLALPFNLVDFSTSTANWMMTGSSSSWKDAKPGKVFNACVRGDVANPLFLCDEIDKAGGDSRYPVVNVFYTLLERDMAKSFSDEFYPEFKIDASHILYVATANSTQTIPDAILSRFHVIEIQEPTQEQMPAIINSVYRSIRESDGHRMFPEILSSDVIEYFVRHTPRQVKGILNLAFANAAYRAKKGKINELSISLDDLQERKDGKRGMGFMPG